jgi:hypothetical protein
MTTKLLKLVQKKSAAYKEHRQCRTNEHLKSKFQDLSAKVKKEIRKVKISYYSRKLEENEINPKEYWNIVNEVRRTRTNQSIDVINVNNVPTTVIGNEAIIAEKFNEYFNLIPSKLLADRCITPREINLSNDESVPMPKIVYNNEMLSTKIESFQLAESDIEKAISKLKNNRSCGSDGILPTTIKVAPKFFAKILTPVFNLSLRSGIFPEILKETFIVPVFKTGEKSKVENYRPISITSAISKIFEICVKEKLLNYLEHIGFFAPNQFGFIPKKSTDAALFQHISDITENVEHNRATVGIYLDFAKAFDTIDQLLLCSKLQKAGIRGPLLGWFRTYLTNRRHKTKINNILSTELTSEYGIPQGSVLGPFLFIIYINDLYSLPLKAEVITFADDTSLLYNGPTVQHILDNFQYDQRILLPWFRNNLMHLNAGKCKFMVFAYKTPEWANTIQVKTDEGLIERVKEIKYLGVIIDEKLTWKQHSIYLQSKLRKQNYLFYHLKNYFNSWHLRKLYVPLYESVFSYGIIHWGASACVKPIKVRQNKVCRSILSLNKRTSEKDIYQTIQKMRVEELYRYRLLMYLFKNKNSFHLHNTELVTRTGSTTRAKLLIYNKEHSRKQAKYQAQRLFNGLPAILRGETVLSKFKRAIRQNHVKYSRRSDR